MLTYPYEWKSLQKTENNIKIDPPPYFVRL